MKPILPPGTFPARWPRVFVWLWLAVAALLPGLAHAQSPGPDGGTLSPATSTVCAGFNSGTLTLTGYTGSILKYQANSGNGYVDIANTAPTYTFSNLTQTTSFRAVVQNGANAAVTSTVATVTVNQPPTATINSQGPTRFCQQGTIYLVAGPGGNYTYQFLRNGINIAGATSQVYSALVTNSGSYSVRVTDAAGCSAVSSSINIQVQPQNVVTLSATTSTTFCQGGSVLLTANVTGPGASGYTYQFLKNGNQIPGATNSTYSATTSGSYTVVVNNPSTCSATSNAVTVTATPPTVATISYPASSYCQSGAPNPTPTATPAGGTFASSTGLSLNTTTGVINLAQSQPGTYSVSYTSGGTCPGTAAASVTITAPPTADFSYAGGSRCAGSAGTLAPTLASGATAGTYSASPAGLSLTASTGAIDLAQSQPGTYTVTNIVAPANGCAAVSATTSVVLTAQPVAVLAASGPTTFCQGGSVVLTASGGAAGATYQFLNNGQAIAGATAATYTASASGSYGVVITNPGGCAGTSAATAVTVNPGTTATFSYASTALCQSSAAITPTTSGTAGGTFSAGSGLTLDAGTGAITPGTSTPGTYTVTYAVGGPCPSSSTQSVTITAPALATFSYGAATYCVGGTNPAPTFGSGASAGTFSSTAGLVLNAGTGTLDLARSQPGTYTVTNTVAAAGGCPAATATAQVSIAAVPVASLAAGGPTTFCQGGSVTLTANGGGAGSTYQFLSNGQPISGATNSTFAASASGSYSVVITNAGVCTATSAATAVTVNPAATPTLSYAAASFCQGTGTASPTVSISGGSFSASAAGLSINSTTGVLSLAQSQPGTYTVTYVAGTPCPGSATATVTITATPSAAFAYAGGTFCPTAANPTPTITGAAGGTFSAPAGLVIDPATGTLNLQTSTAGTYAVAYSVAGTCPASSTVSVTITTAPVATFGYASTTGYCAGSPTAASPAFTGGGSAGTFSAAPAGLSLNPTTGAIDLTQSQPGTYTVTNTIAASGACAAVSATASVTVNPTPVASLTAGGPTTFCAGGSVVLTAPAGTGLTYQFLRGGQPIGSATAASYTATTAGSYAVAVTNASGCTSTSPATAVTVNPATTATFTYPTASFCRSSALLTTPTITGTAGGTFSAAPGLTLDPATGAITPGSSTAGTYTVTYSVGGTCPSTGTQSVTITTPALAAFGYANAAYCATGTAAVVLATGSTAGTFASAAGLSVNATTGALDLANSTPGTYTVTNTVAASGGCTAVTATATVTVNPLPARPTLTAQYNGPTTTLTSSAPTGNQFYLNGTAIAGATGPSYVVNSAAQLGSYTVTTTNANGCPSLPSAPLVVTATAKQLAEAALQLYPNPTPDGKLTLTLTTAHQAVQLSVLNALGQVVYRAVVPASSAAATQPLDLSALSTGVYLLRATTAEGTATRRFVRE